MLESQTSAKGTVSDVDWREGSAKARLTASQSLPWRYPSDNIAKSFAKVVGVPRFGTEGTECPGIERMCEQYVWAWLSLVERPLQDRKGIEEHSGQTLCHSESVPI